MFSLRSERTGDTTAEQWNNGYLTPAIGHETDIAAMRVPRRECPFIFVTLALLADARLQLFPTAKVGATGNANQCRGGFR